MATLTTPDRSQSTPASAPKISGRARMNVPRMMLTSGMKFCPVGAAETCQQRNESTKPTSPTPSTGRNQRFGTPASSAAPAAIAMIPNRIAPIVPLISNAAPAASSLSVNRACWSVASAPKSTADSRPSASSVRPTLRVRVQKPSSTAATATSGTAMVDMRYQPFARLVCNRAARAARSWKIAFTRAGAAMKMTISA